MTSVGVYCFSYDNPEKKQKMTDKFKLTGYDVNWVDIVTSDDPRNLKGHERCSSVMWNHLDMIKAFLHSDNDYGVFCEDDIYIRKTFAEDIQEVIRLYERSGVELILLSWLTTFCPYNCVYFFEPYECDKPIFTLHQYPNHCWGAHMYFMNKKHAEAILNFFTLDFATKTLDESNNLPPWASDWTITKWGKRAALWPMLGVEYGIVNTTNEGQVSFHRDCTNACYEEGKYL